MLADFLVDHPCVDVENAYASMAELKPWKLYFDGLRHQNGVSIGVFILSPNKEPIKFMFKLEQVCPSNEAKYGALIVGLEIFLQHWARNVKVIGDSQLVIKQVTMEYKCISENLGKYLSMATHLLVEFDNVKIKQILRKSNFEANKLAQIASSYKTKSSTLRQCFFWPKGDLFCRPTESL